MNTLTHLRVRELLDYDPDTGAFIWKKQSGRALAGTSAGYTHSTLKYRILGLDGNKYYAHRVAWLYVHGEWPHYIDHINGDPEDNRLSNLRSVPPRVNQENQHRAKRGSNTPFLGVHRRADTGRYSASVKAKGKAYYLGCFHTPEEAHAAYLKAKRELHEGCTI